jgi:O-antigen/teichoic acid export membrane protein
MSLSRRIAFNTATTWVSGILSALVALALIPFLQWQIGLSGYGLTVIIATLVSLSMMADLGLRGALSRHLASAFASQDTERVNSLFSAAMCCFMGLAFVLMTLFFFAAPWVAAGYDRVSDSVSAEDLPQIVLLLRYYAPLQTLLWFVAPAYAGVLEGNHRFDLVSLDHIIEVVARAVSVVALVGLTDLGIVGWAIGMLGSKLISLVVLMVLAHRVWPTLSVRPRFIQRESFAQLATLGGFVFLYWNVFRLSVQTDSLVLGAILGPAAVGMYKPASEAVWAISPFVAGLIRQIAPLAASMDANGHGARLSELFISGTRLTLLMALPFLITLACFAQPFVRVWLVDAHNATAHVIILFVIADLIGYAGGPQWEILLGMNRVRFIVGLEFFLALVNLSCSILLVCLLQQWGWGDDAILGAAIPTVVCRLFSRVILTVHTTRATGTSVAVLVRQGYFGPSLVMLILLAVGLTLRLLVQPVSLTSLAACVIVPPLVWMPACWFLGFQGEDRLRIARLARQLFGSKAVAGT